MRALGMTTQRSHDAAIRDQFTRQAAGFYPRKASADRVELLDRRSGSQE